MNFDRNGTLVRTTQPVRELRTVKKTILIDSRDRDPTKYVKVNGGPGSGTTGTGLIGSDPGDYVVYLPRPLENVVSLRLKSAIIRAPETTNFTENYVLLSIEGLNKIDETAYGANRAGFVDNTFARISNPNFTKSATGVDLTIFYNDKSDEENITRYTPAIGTLDRFHITLKYHSGVASSATALGDVTGRVLNAPITFGTSENSFTFEVETMDNGFTDFSTFQTRVDSVNYVR
jgi:hypothetical protein